MDKRRVDSCEHANHARLCKLTEVGGRIGARPPFNHPNLAVVVEVVSSAGTCDYGRGEYGPSSDRSIFDDGCSHMATHRFIHNRDGLDNTARIVSWH